ncbi:MAG: tRNA pseudouridine65 synthase [Parasphingorhabdus sp.]
MSLLKIVYQDRDIVGIDKPAKMLVHRSAIDRHETVFALQALRDQLGIQVYPIHRLDKPTSGILLFATSSEMASLLGQEMQNHRVEKTYWLVCRGHPPDLDRIDYALKPLDDFKSLRKKGRVKELSAAEPQEAVTDFRTLSQVEIPTAIDKYPTSRYSLVEARPKTGRKHQIRRHFKHISHPIIGDIRYGKGTHNRYFSDQLKCDRLLLHSYGVKFTHPNTEQPIEITCPPDGQFHDALVALSLNSCPDKLA